MRYVSLFNHQIGVNLFPSTRGHGGTDGWSLWAVSSPHLAHHPDFLCPPTSPQPPSCQVPHTPWKWRKCLFPSHSSKLCQLLPPLPTSPTAPPRFSSDEVSSQREYFGPVLCSQTNSPGSFNLVSINIITVCSVISTLPWFVHVIHALASTPRAVLYTHTQMPICVYILHVMYGHHVLKEGYAFHHACNFFSSSSKSVS